MTRQEFINKSGGVFKNNKYYKNWGSSQKKENFGISLI